MECNVDIYKVLPCIVVLNHKYFPNSKGHVNIVGATSFALEVIKCLKKYKSLSGIILYKRDESINVPVLEEKKELDYYIITLRFNFNMDSNDIKHAIEQAIFKMYAKHNINHYPIVYYHTDTLMKYHPEYIPSCVTHHGPFVDDFINHYSRSNAYIAYETKEKTEHLLKFQQEGLDALIKKENTFVLQHSELQKNYILKRGFDGKKIYKISPPRLYNCDNLILPDEIIDFISLNMNQMLLISAVARIDYFKNLDLLVRSSLKLLEEGIPIKVLIIGGSKSDSQKRVQLYKIIPNELKDKFLIRESHPQNEMYLLFKLLSKKAVFVCTSRYETLGITPLEATLSGVYTILPNLKIIEAANYFPEKYKFNPTTLGLAECLKNVYIGNLFSSDSQYNYISQKITINKFEESLMNALKIISEFYLEPQKV